MDLAQVSDQSLDLTDDQLVIAAAGGDQVAAGRYLARNLTYLSVMSRRLAMNRIDPEDLLADAVARLLELWKSGTGPTDEINRYVIASMRNRVIDELRSPRSRVAALDTVPELALVADDEPSIARVDVSAELSTVRRAFELLPVAQQLVLREVVVQGRKPAELVDELQRAAPAISSLLRRAKIGLRRSLLVLMLSERGDAECTANAQLVPDSALSSPADYPISDHRLDHARGCSKCQNAWSRFAALATVLGVLPLLVIARAVFDAPSVASADEVDTVHRTDLHRSARPRIAQYRSPLRVASMPRILIGSAAILVGAILVAAPVIDPTLTALTESVALSDSVDGAPESTAELQVKLSPWDEELLLDVTFRVLDADWTVDSLQLDLPPTATVGTVPSGWSCTMFDGHAECTTSSTNATGGMFHLSVPSGSREKYAVHLVAHSASTEITADATGVIP